MKKRLLVLGPVVLLVILVLLVPPPCHYVVLGFLRGEHFFRGKPTSYWRDALMQADVRLHSTSHWYDEWVARCGITRPWPPLGNMSEFVSVTPQARPFLAMFENEPTAVPVLLDLLKDGEPVIRSNAAQAMGEIQPPSEPAVAGLIEALSDESYGVRLNAARALGSMGRTAESAIPTLMELLADEDPLESVP